MKNSILFLIHLSVIVSLNSQTQLDIQGSTSSSDTVVKVKVNYVGMNNIVGLYSKSEPNAGYGIGGDFYGVRIAAKVTPLLPQSDPPVEKIN